MSSIDVEGEATSVGRPMSMPVMTLSAAEARFERLRQTAGLFAGPIAFALVWMVPFDLSVEAHRLAAIVALVVTWWVTEAIPIPATALIGAALTVLFGVTTATAAFAPFANPVIFLFLGSFMIGRAMAEHGLDQRWATQVLSLRAVRGNLARVRVALTLLCVGMSAWMSNTATAAMIVPVALGLLASVGVTTLPGARHYTSGFFLTLAYGIAVGGLMTPVGSPPNLITIGLLDRLAGVRIGFLTWSLMMIPIASSIGLAMLVMSRQLFPDIAPPAIAPPARPAPPDPEQPAGKRPPAVGRMTTGQRNCLIAFGTAVVLWVTPGLVSLVGGPEFLRPLVSRLDEGVVAIVAASLLFLLPTDWQARRFTMGWAQASHIDWGTILLFGAGLSLGHQMFETGLAKQLGETLATATGAESLWAITAMALALGILLTEITSNTAATNMLVPVMISIAQASGVNPVPPALATGVGASMAFMLPISTPPNAIMYGTGLVRIGDMIKFGVLLDIVGFCIALIGLRVLCPLFGFS
jgi:sodium-dependent dicarboxylate transporter 2/3/5